MFTAHPSSGVSAGRSSLVSYVVGDLFLSRAFPAGVFGVFLVAKTSDLSQRLLVTGSHDVMSFSLLAYASQQALTIVFLAVVVALFLVRRPVIGPHSSISGGLVALAGTFVLSIPVGARVSEENTIALLVSSALMIVGVGFSIVSAMALGRCFGLMPEARGLVTSGPYARVRHPLYVGETISALGLTVAAASPLMIALFALYCGLQYWRALNEEKVLGKIFPEYEEYCRHTARFLPGVHP